MGRQQIIKLCQNCKNRIYRRTFCSKKCCGEYKRNNYNLFSKELLIDLYITQNISVEEIAKKFNRSVGVVYQYLRKHKIEYKKQYIDFTGQRRGKIEILKPVASNHKGGGKHVKWLVRCDCGIEYEIISSTLNSCNNLCCEKCRYIASRSKEELKNYIWNALKYVAKTRKKEFSITKEYAYQLFLQQDKKCALTGRNIKFATHAKAHTQGETTASLDRIDSSKGYVEGNVQWLHKDVNKMKWDLSQEDFIKICKEVVNLHC